MGRRTTALLTAGILGVGLLTACDPGGSSGEGMEDPAPADDAAVDATAEDDEAAERDNGAGGEDGDGDAAGETLTTTETDLGTFLVDGAGMTLYLFTADSPGVSACMDECLENWPILEGEPSAGDGVDEALLGSIERDDGTVQATYADWPLYYFVQDSSPGDVTGQGVQDVWYVVAPDGQMITAEDEDSRPGY